MSAEGWSFKGARVNLSSHGAMSCRQQGLMAAKIAIIYVVAFIVTFISHTFWKWVRNRYGMESIIYFLSILFPLASASVGVVQVALHVGDSHLLEVEGISFLVCCYCSYYLYRRVKGLDARFGRLRITPEDGIVGCLTDFIVVGCAVMFLLMQIIFPYRQLLEYF